ncbi:chorismate mutase [Pantoea sp. RRHST58]|uniref:chorismate mutase n=1 Tax=Pantoea sp. RRHST58 TaxID=3425183 RepID=UPI003DA05A5D
MDFTCIEEVRTRIDEIDDALVKIIAQRAKCVKAAAAFKSDSAAVRAPDRVEQVINKARENAAKAGVPEIIIEKVYRSMINAFIDYELKQHEQLQKDQSDSGRH